MSLKFKLIISDIAIITISVVLSFLIRFDFKIPAEYHSIILTWIPLISFIQFFTFILSDMYARLWRFTSLFDLFAIFKTITLSSLISVIGIFLIIGSTGYPRSTIILHFFFNLIGVLFSRLTIRIYHSHYAKNTIIKKENKIINVLLIGAGKTGDKISRDLLTSYKSQYKIIGFVDDDPKKIGQMLHGIKILCKVSEIKNLSVEFDEIIITTRSATSEEIRRIIKSCKNSGKKYKTVPSLGELMDKKISFAAIRNVSYVDLLGRNEVTLDMNSIENLIKGKRILISGAGGSIGSELVKQCLQFNPSEIICFDQSEEAIFNLEQNSNNINTITVLKYILGNINDINELRKVFNDNIPHIVFHAAAYKHVPIQENHPWAAVKTNIGGSMNIIELANEFKTEKFILVSTDKAVNPVNVMGATKRIAEYLVQGMNSKSETKFMAVRFGNVLGSSGSAIPIFERQIKAGGPITITHPEMTRYFMSIPEASQLIIQCGALGKEGEIFLLDMGKPIKIVQMVKDLIRLSGFEPEKDIPIVYTGLRPGEKLYEELQLINETKVDTTHTKITVLKSKKDEHSWGNLKKEVKILLDNAEKLDADLILTNLKKINPSYSPSLKNYVNKTENKNILTDYNENYNAEA
jgi:FlaA1/EpsC-like NDP-sugar epimerase